MIGAICLPASPFLCSGGQYSTGSSKPALNYGKGVGKVPRLIITKTLHNPNNLRFLIESISLDAFTSSIVY